MRTKDDVEIDLIVERPGKKMLCLEIKSSDHVHADKLTAFRKISKELGNNEAICITQENRARKIGEITILPWLTALNKYFCR